MNKRIFPIIVFAATLGLSSYFLGAAVVTDSRELTPPPATTASNPSAIPTEATQSPETFRSYLLLQEQLHETQLAVERAEREMELATYKSAAILSNRLQAIEQTVELQRAHEMNIVHDMMFIAGAFVVVGVFALLLTSYFHWRAVSRLGEIAAALPAGRGLGAVPTVAGLGLGEAPLLLEQTNSRLLSTIERLEKRIAELENDDTRILTNSSAHPGTGSAEAPKPLPEITVEPAQTKTASPVDRSAEVAELVSKGQTLLARDSAEEALDCFNQALALQPQHAELLVKKGDALDQLRRTKEALECYDRALAIDGSMTIAYLHKGGLLNRVERFDEAMHCYEQALRTQTKERAA
ncbi:MAG: hypothetical protein U1F65_11685 [Verrucomicrobiota bacterium]